VASGPYNRGVRRLDHDRPDTTAWKLGLIVDCYAPLLIGIVMLVGMIVAEWFAAGEPFAS
jgi:hypothetical protein